MTSPTMRAAAYLGPGQIAIQSRAIPEPGPGEVRVRVGACGLCGSDLHLLHAPTPFMAPGTTMGHEIAGTVDAVGDGVADFSGGESVVVEPLRTCGTCRYCADGRDSLCPGVGIHGVQLEGGFADYLTVQARRLYRVPAGLDVRLAALAEPTAVAVHGLRLGGFQPGGRVLVLGAGTIGLAAVGVAKAWGAAEIVLTARHPHQAERGRALGATTVLSGADATAEALAAFGKEQPADMVVESVGGTADTLTGAVAALAPGGTIVVLGFFLEPVVLDPLTLFLKEGRLQWSNCYARAPGMADFDEAVRLLGGDGATWSSLLTHAVPLDEIGRAFALAGDKTSGAVKVTVVPGR